MKMRLSANLVSVCWLRIHEERGTAKSGLRNAVHLPGGQRFSLRVVPIPAVRSARLGNHAKMQMEQRGKRDRGWEGNMLEDD